MRFIASLALGLLATQANVCSALKAYTLSAGLTCTADSDNIHLSYQLNGLDAPAPFSNQIYNVAYRLTLKADNSIVTVPTSAVAATAGCGYSSIYTPGNVGGVNSDSMGATQSGNLALNGTILYHQQVDNVAAVSGTFDVDVVSAAAASLTCINGVPSAQLVPLSYSINGISQLVINSYNYPKAVLPTAVYSFEIQPALNIDPCYVDPKTNNTRVPWRVSGLATLNSTESGIMSIVVTNSNGDLISSWIQMPDANQVGTFTRDPVEPSIISATQPNGPTQVFGRIDFEQGDSTVMCDAQGKSNIMFEVLDYSTIRGGVQTFHYIPGAVDNGQNSTSWLPQAVHRLHTMAATAAPTKAPTAAQAAARKAAAKKAAAAAKAKAAAAATAAAAAAAAAAVPGTTTPCTLLVPPNPLTATGLMTPYVLGGGCTMADTAGFVQAVFIDPATGTVQMYAPLVIQNGKKAAVAPGKVTLPANAVVGLWFGSNANLQMLTAANAATLTNAKCVNGAQVNGALSIFGQVAACNSVAFFQAAALAVFQGLLTVPPLGTAIDGQACPTTRSFFTIDQDPGDNLQTTYLLDANGNTAINTPANLATLTAAAKAAKQAPPTVLTNPGDNPLLNKFLNPTMKCNSWMVPDQSNGNTLSANQPLNEVSAAFLQQAPIARQPALNPMCSVNGVANLGKLNACRSLIGEAPVQNLNMASTATFCKNMVGTAGAVRLLGNMAVLAAAAGPTAGQSLFQFLQDRFAAAVGPGNLMCGKLVPGLTNPLAGGAVIAAQSAFQVADALLVGAAAPDNAAMDPMAELAGTPIGGSTTDNTGSSSSSFPVAIVAGVVGGVVALLIAALVITQVVKKRGQDAVGNTSRREGKV